MNMKYKLALLLVASALFVQAALANPPQKAEALKIVDGPRVESVGPNWAVVAWTTNTGGSSIVRYGTSRTALNQTAQAPYADNESTQQQVHRVRIQNLQPGTTYYFMVDSGQGEGTGTEAKGAIASFTTKGAGSSAVSSGEDESRGKAEAVKIVDGPRVEGVGDTWAVIAWTTNSGSSSVVRYGTDKNALNQMGQAPYAEAEGASRQTHRVKLQNLKPNTVYYFMVDSGQGEGTGTEAKSQISQFKTK